jgi:hypothetical protein
MTPGDTGPHLQVAVLCESVIEDKQGVLSLIRVVDQITQTAVGPDVPDEMPAFTLEALTMVISLKADQARGRYTVKIRPEAPGGVQLPAMQMPIQLDGGERGINLISRLNFLVEQEGIYWFDILFSPKKGEEDRLLTRIPLRVIYQPQRTESE